MVSLGRRILVDLGLFRAWVGAVGVCTMSVVCFGPRKRGSCTAGAFGPGRRVPQWHVVGGTSALSESPVGGHDLGAHHLVGVFGAPAT
jgi:hypothetical protein